MCIMTVPNRNKTKELILYISSRLKDRPNYGATLLNKSLYFIDSMSYLKKGKPITDFGYIKQQFGPTPKPSQFLSIRDEMVANEDLEVSSTTYFGRGQTKYVAKREPLINVFDKDELVTITDVLENICDANAIDISEYSHRFLAWEFANDKELLPLFTFLLTSKEPETGDYAWANIAIENYRKNKQRD